MGATHSFWISGELQAKLRRLGQAEGVTLFMRAIPPELQFDLLGAFKKLARRERRFHRNGEVDEMRLVLEAP